MLRKTAVLGACLLAAVGPATAATHELKATKDTVVLRITF